MVRSLIGPVRERLNLGSGSAAVSRSGVQRANSFMLLVLALQRVSYLIPTVTTFSSPDYRSIGVNRLLIVATVLWNIALLTTAKRRGWFPRLACWLDVTWAAALLIAVPLNSPSGAEYDSLNWATRFGQAAAALAGVAIEPLIAVVAALAVLLAAHGIVTVVVLHHSDLLVPELITCLNGLIWFAIILGFSLRYLRRQGQQLDRLTAGEAAAESRRAAERAREKLRLAHYRSLHDTVLATLTALARGHLDHDSAQVRQRCAQDAEQVRSLLANPVDEGISVLADSLAEVAAAAAGLGLRVRARWQDLPGYLPSDVVEAVASAAREALNNVAAHAGVTQAWLTAVWADDSLIVRVVDRGQGFAADSAAPQFGLQRSIIDRMREVGGDARVTAAPGEGACVELTWTA
jgi:signal transduction histidine kinase